MRPGSLRQQKARKKGRRVADIALLDPAGVPASLVGQGIYSHVVMLVRQNSGRFTRLVRRKTSLSAHKLP